MVADYDLLPRMMLRTDAIASVGSTLHQLPATRLECSPPLLSLQPTISINVVAIDQYKSQYYNFHSASILINQIESLSTKFISSSLNAGIDSPSSQEVEDPLQHKIHPTFHAITQLRPYPLSPLPKPSDPKSSHATNTLLICLDSPPS